MPTCSHSVYEVFAHQKTDLLLHLLSQDLQSSQKTLVFVRSREQLQALTTALLHAGLAADSISGNKKPELRDRALRELLTGDLHLVIATAAPLRDSNLSGIEQIIHFDPYELESDYLAHLDLARVELSTFISQNDQKTLKSLDELSDTPPTRKKAPDFDYHNQPRKIRGPIKKTHAANKTNSKPLQNKKPKLKNKGPRRKTGRTRKR